MPTFLSTYKVFPVGAIFTIGSKSKSEAATPCLCLLVTIGSKVKTIMVDFVFSKMMIMFDWKYAPH